MGLTVHLCLNHGQFLLQKFTHHSVISTVRGDELMVI